MDVNPLCATQRNLQIYLMTSLLGWNPGMGPPPQDFRQGAGPPAGPLAQGPPQRGPPPMTGMPQFQGYGQVGGFGQSECKGKIRLFSSSF